MTRDYATLFQNVMDEIWDPGSAALGNSPDFIVKAIADKVRGTQRVNPENAFDVLDLFGPEYVTWMESRGAETNEPDVSIHTIKFSDDSSLLIEAKRGIGSGIESL